MAGIPELMKTWFDSRYYHLLYNYRNDDEARGFMDTLLRSIHAVPGSSILDLCCGKGRHSIYLHSRGFDVTGIDYAPASIAEASRSAAPGLRFRVQDMRDPLGGPYSIILNMFTSFGYFTEPGQDLDVARSIAASLATDGIFVLDYLNSARSARLLVPAEEVQRDHITFSIRRSQENGFFIKRIFVRDGPSTFEFAEQVRAYTPEELRTLFEDSGIGLKVTDVWGDYEGRPFDPENSPRLVLFMKHPQR